MRRGEIVTVAMPGDFGKPRPALVIQADQFEHTGTVWRKKTGPLTVTINRD